MTFTFNEIACLDGDGDNSEDETLVGDADSNTSSKPSSTRIVIRYMIKQQAAMINAPIENDICTHISHLEIKKNTVEGERLMINYATGPDVFFGSMQLWRRD